MDRKLLCNKYHRSTPASMLPMSKNTKVQSGSDNTRKVKDTENSFKDILFSASTFRPMLLMLDESEEDVEVISAIVLLRLTATMTLMLQTRMMMKGTNINKPALEMTTNSSMPPNPSAVVGMEKGLWQY